jgi:hypothetical protein
MRTVRAGLDLVFVSDGTGSMMGKMRAVKQHIEQIVQRMRQEYPKLRLRLAIIIYRDFDYAEAQQLETLDFTEDVGVFKAFLDRAQVIPSRGLRGELEVIGYMTDSLLFPTPNRLVTSLRSTFADPTRLPCS